MQATFQGNVASTRNISELSLPQTYVYLFIYSLFGAGLAQAV
jgi:hypothetical protein